MWFKLFVFLTWCNLCNCVTYTRVVRTKYGDVRGELITHDSKLLDKVEVYRGIPYAAPPTGSLRFMPPVSGALWSGVKYALKFEPVCPQKLPDITDESQALRKMPKGRLNHLKRLIPHLKNQSEDCLYLNIYAPKQDGEKLKRYPVVVYVHGESFEWNSGNPYDGSVLSSYAGLVVVTVNYRLGILGFLNMNRNINERSPSNYGLMDLIAALHWLQENIVYFGGDPTNVTLLGHDTGAACINFLMVSTAVPEGSLFHRVILMSGSSLSPWSLARNPLSVATQVAQNSNCSATYPHQKLLHCLREKPLNSLLNVETNTLEFTTGIGPNIDGVVIDMGFTEKYKKQPQKADENEKDLLDWNEKEELHSKFNPSNDYNSIILSNQAIKLRLFNKLSKYDMMAGVVPSESLSSFSEEQIQFGFEQDKRWNIIRDLIKNVYRYHLREILAVIVNEYTEWERPIQHPINIKDMTADALSDSQYTAPVVQIADLHSTARRNSYFYVFEYQTKSTEYQQRQGCVHGEELAYIFGAPLVDALGYFPNNYTKAESSLSESMMLYISNFARTGNPNDPGTGQEMIQKAIMLDKNRIKAVEWTPYEAIHKKYLSFDGKLKLKDHYRAHKLSYWNNLIPDLHRPGATEIPPDHQLHTNQINFVSEDKKEIEREDWNSTVNKIAVSNESSHSPVVEVIASSSSDRATKKRDKQTSSSDIENSDDFPTYTTALIVTIIIGCILLTFNILVFVFIYYKSDKTTSKSNQKCDSALSLNSANSQAESANFRKITENGAPASGGPRELLQLMETRKCVKMLPEAHRYEYQIDTKESDNNIKFDDVEMLHCSLQRVPPPPPPKSIIKSSCNNIMEAPPPPVKCRIENENVHPHWSSQYDISMTLPKGSHKMLKDKSVGTTLETSFAGT